MFSGTNNDHYFRSVILEAKGVNVGIPTQGVINIYFYILEHLYMTLFKSLSHNVGVGGVIDEMTIHTHVYKTNKKTQKKQQQHCLSDTFSVGRSAFLYYFSTWHIKDQKEKSEYDKEIPQSHTAEQDQS